MDCSKRSSVKMPNAMTLFPKNFCFDNFSTYYSYCLKGVRVYQGILREYQSRTPSELPLHSIPYEKSPFHLSAFHAYNCTALRKSYHLSVKLILIKIIIITMSFSLLLLCMCAQSYLSVDYIVVSICLYASLSH